MFYSNYFSQLYQLFKTVSEDDLIEISEKILDVSSRGKKIILVGNGGSSNIAGHLAVDFTNAAGVEAVSFNDTGLITCFSNDYGYENWISNALDHYGKPGDMLISISSSGKSQNILNGVTKAKKKEIFNLTLSGFGSNNPLKLAGDKNLWVDSKSYNFIEMSHHIWLVAIVDYICQLKKGV